MITDEKRRKLYPVYASGAALATASSIAGTTFVIWVVLFATVGCFMNFKLNTWIIVLGSIASLAAGVASYRWAFTYFMTQKKDIP